jgi:hypothetical protein
MSEGLNKQLSDLADKLGVSLDHLWGVLVKQAYIDGFSSSATTIVCVLLGIVIVYFFLRLRRRFKDRPSEDAPPPFAVLMEPFGFIIVGIVLLFIVLVACDNLYWVVSDFANPEFYALRHLPFLK